MRISLLPSPFAADATSVIVNRTTNCIFAFNNTGLTNLGFIVPPLRPAMPLEVSAAGGHCLRTR